MRSIHACPCAQLHLSTLVHYFGQWTGEALYAKVGQHLTLAPLSQSFDRAEYSRSFSVDINRLGVQVDGKYVWTNAHRQKGAGGGLSLSKCVAAQLGDSVDVYLPHTALNAEVLSLGVVMPCDA